MSWVRPCMGKPERLGVLMLTALLNLKIMHSLFTQIRVGPVCIMLIPEVN